MATAESVKNKIQDLINSANAVTGQSDADMTTAVAALIAGFGTGGESGTFHFGTYMTEERVIEDLEFPTPGGVSYFVIFMTEAPATDTGKAFCIGLMGCKTGVTVSSGSGNTGTSVSSATSYAIGKSYSYYYGLKFDADCVQLLASAANESYCRVMQAGKNYVWIAW